MSVTISPFARSLHDLTSLLFSQSQSRGDDDDDDDTSLAGVLIPIATNDNDNSDAESNHNSIDPNEADDNSSKASVHSTRSQAPVHSMIDEPSQLPPDEEELDNTDDMQLPEQETQVPILHQSKRVSIPPSDYIPQMGGKTYAMNEQTETNQDEDKGLVYNHDEAGVLATIITTFNEQMEHTVEEQGQQYIVTYSLKAGINKFGKQAKASAHKEMKQLHDRSCFRPVHKCSLNKRKGKEQWNHLCF